MLELTSNGTPIVLTPGTSVQLEYNSPLFDEEVLQGNFSYGLSVPAAPNGEVYGYPELPENAASAPRELPATLSDDGHVLLEGIQQLRAASPTRYAVNVIGGLNAVVGQLHQRKIHSFCYGGPRTLPLFVPLEPQYPAMPGIVAHANDVVRNPKDYDYVFAPLANPSFLDPEKPNPNTFVNPWAHEPEPIFGQPEEGTFAYFFTVGQVPGSSSPPPEQPPMCPFPWLRYVLSSIFSEAGFRIEQEAFMPGELADLVIAGNACINSADMLGFPAAFQLADVLPDLTVAELLYKLRNDFGLVVVMSDEQTVRTIYHKDLPGNPDYIDLTHLASAARETEYGEPKGVTLTYTVDPADQAFEGLLNDLTMYEQGEPVALLSDLPTQVAVVYDAQGVPSLPAQQIRLVEEKQAYYLGRYYYAHGQATSYVSWAFYSLDHASYLVAGGGEEFAQGLTTTRMDVRTFTYATGNTGLYPCMDQPGYILGRKVPRSTALRLLFWRGMQPMQGTDRFYPMLSTGNTNLLGETVGECTLRLGGEDGTVSKWLSAWLRVKLTPSLMKDSWALSSFELSQLNYIRKVRIDGVDYLVRKVSATVPMRKRATVQLVKL
jgi:hypothetical protein